MDKRLLQHCATLLRRHNTDQEFLKRGGVFTTELIEQWVSLKEKEIRSIGTMPHPFEYKLYFNL